MNARALVVILVLVVATFGIGRASRTERIPTRDSLWNLPTYVAGWQGQQTDRLDQQTLTVLGADDYLNRFYVSPVHGGVGFFIGYYQSQRVGSKLHSPLICLPGAGWETLQEQLLTIPVTTNSGRRIIEVNRMIVAKGLERQVVLFWFQSQGRVIASEYWGKLYSMVDAARRRRTDTAIVRVMSPVLGSDAGAEARAEQAAIAFTQAVFPLLGRYLPE